MFYLNIIEFILFTNQLILTLLCIMIIMMLNLHYQNINIIYKYYILITFYYYQNYLIFIINIILINIIYIKVLIKYHII